MLHGLRVLLQSLVSNKSVFEAVKEDLVQSLFYWFLELNVLDVCFKCKGLWVTQKIQSLPKILQIDCIYSSAIFDFEWE